MTTYAQNTLNMAANIAFAATIVNGGVSVVFESVSGWLSDKYGRKPVMLIPGVLLVLLTVPVFLLIVQVHTPAALLFGVGVIAFLGAMSQPALIVALTEGFPQNIRARGLSTVYALAIATFGGSTQVVVTLILKYTNDPISPAWFLTAAATVGVIAMLLFPETAPVKTEQSSKV
jgi:MFS family permease